MTGDERRAHEVAVLEVRERPNDQHAGEQGEKRAISAGSAERLRKAVCHDEERHRGCGDAHRRCQRRAVEVVVLHHHESVDDAHDASEHQQRQQAFPDGHESPKVRSQGGSIPLLLRARRHLVASLRLAAGKRVACNSFRASIEQCARHKRRHDAGKHDQRRAVLQGQGDRGGQQHRRGQRLHAGGELHLRHDFYPSQREHDRGGSLRESKRHQRDCWIDGRESAAVRQHRGGRQHQRGRDHWHG